MTRVTFSGEQRHYPSYAPRVLWNRLLHVTILGPLLGCSCTRCFKHPWRLYYWREGVRDRVRVAELERELADVKRECVRLAPIDSRLETARRLGVRVELRHPKVVRDV
jgi:hypothetical protein